MKSYSFHLAYLDPELNVAVVPPSLLTLYGHIFTNIGGILELSILRNISSNRMFPSTLQVSRIASPRKTQRSAYFLFGCLAMIVFAIVAHACFPLFSSFYQIPSQTSAVLYLVRHFHSSNT